MHPPHPRDRLAASAATLRGAWLLCVLALALGAAPARAGGGFLGIDSRVSYDNSGFFRRSNQNILIYSEMALVGGGALWEGGESRFGKTLWQSVDAGVVSGVAAYALKYAFSRERPSQTSDPNRWFTGHGQSFPSGEVTTTSSLITPLVFEYGREQPAVYALELIPIYDAIARVKVRGHWQTDVIAGYALGSVTGWLMHKRYSPLILSVMPHGIQVGLHTEF